MCDGITQGRDGMQLSLFSRDVIAMATAIALSHDMFDGVLLLGVCDKIDHSDEHRGISQDAQRWLRGRQLAHACRCRRTRRLGPDLEPGCRRPRNSPTLQCESLNPSDHFT
jgi:hypothetical protein